MRIFSVIFLLLLFALSCSLARADEPVKVAGVYPHLTMYNNEGECGTGAVVPWADRLWVITYGPHKPLGSSDKLYEITSGLKQVIRSESVGGTPANRLIHRESNQLNIGPYFIDAKRNLRVIAPRTMPGRLTGSARHLVDPASKIYIATMEEGLYSVDVDTLEVVEHIKDGNGQRAIGSGIKSALPGYHGKGLYTGGKRLIYANNGTRGDIQNPTIPSGSLAEWSGTGDWQLVRRNQFTEVTGPGGIHGNASAQDSVWSLGWDYRSLILMLLDGGEWHAFRLPKGSHSYDGSHGWNTEWPRIRGIGEPHLLATMHGTFWKFPKTFSLANSRGIAPRSNYLKVIGDFTRWNDSIVFGCDDSAQKEFLNTRPFKAHKGAPVQSNSNLWFVNSSLIDQLGPTIGRGSVWLRDDVKAGQASDPYLFAGYDHRMLVIQHDSEQPVEFTLEVDEQGNNQWKTLESLQVDGSLIHLFPPEVRGTWIRLRAGSDAKAATAHFHYRDHDPRPNENDARFATICRIGETPASRGLIRSNRKVLSLHNEHGDYDLNDRLQLAQVPTDSKLFNGVAQPRDVIQVDDASAIIRENGRTYRIPKNDAFGDDTGRICREVATERDLFNFHGTFYELPARNAQGFAKIRPIATHNLAIDDFASHFGLLCMTGLNDKEHPRVVRVPDSKAAIWTGVIDDLWTLGKPRGTGGPWKDSQVKAGKPSDPYLMTGYDRKSLSLKCDKGAKVTVSIDIDGTGIWVPYRTFAIKPGVVTGHDFPVGFSAYWVRVTADKDCLATAWFTYR